MDKKRARIRRATRVRYKLKKLGITRLVVHRTPRHIYAQIFTPDGCKVLVSASTVEKDIINQITYTGNKKAAEIIGQTIAKRAVNNGINKVSFDRSGFHYHGRIQALADAARKAGLQF